MLTRVLQRPSASIAAQVMLATAAVGATIMSVGALYAYHQNETIVRRSLENGLERAVRSRAARIGTWFESRHLLIEMASDDVARTPAGASIERLFARRTLTANFVRSYFGDVHGNFFNYPHQLSRTWRIAGYDARRRPWYREAVNRNHTILTRPYRDATRSGLGEPLITIATPTLAGERLLGVTASDFPVSGIDQLLRDGSAVDGTSFIVDGDGLVLTHPDGRQVGRSLNVLLNDGHVAISSRVAEVRSNGEPAFIVFARIPNLPAANWYIAMIVPQARAFAEFRASQHRSLPLMLIVVGVSLITLWFALRRLVLDPLARVTETTLSIAGGRYETPVPLLGRRDELGAMARAVEVFRTNGIRMRELTEAEVGRLGAEQTARVQMIAALQAAFGTVVEAATRGDFSGRAEVALPDPGLHALGRLLDDLMTVIDSGLGETGRVLSAVARTDLTQRVDGQYYGAFAKLKNDTNAVADKLGDVVGRLRSTAGELRGATSMLVSEAGELDGRTERQTDATRAAVAAIDELTGVVSRTANSARLASEQAEEGAQSARSGRDLLASTADAMERMKVSSTKTSEIIAMVDEVAAQTALLALNASIEAARAGEAGRGFGVLANEIKTLANRAAEASRQASHLIHLTQTDIMCGSTLMHQAANHLSGMIEAAGENDRQLASIAGATHSQLTSIAAIRAAATQVDEVARENAALVDRLGRAVRKTEDHAQQLDIIVDVFTLAGPRPAEPRAARGRCQTDVAGGAGGW